MKLSKLKRVFAGVLAVITIALPLSACNNATSGGSSSTGNVDATGNQTQEVTTLSSEELAKLSPTEKLQSAVGNTDIKISNALSKLSVPASLADSVNLKQSFDTTVTFTPDAEFFSALLGTAVSELATTKLNIFVGVDGLSKLSEKFTLFAGDKNIISADVHFLDGKYYTALPNGNGDEKDLYEVDAAAAGLDVSSFSPEALAPVVEYFTKNKADTDKIHKEINDKILGSLKVTEGAKEKITAGGKEVEADTLTFPVSPAFVRDSLKSASEIVSTHKEYAQAVQLYYDTLKTVLANPAYSSGTDLDELPAIDFTDSAATAKQIDELFTGDDLDKDILNVTMYILNGDVVQTSLLFVGGNTDTDKADIYTYNDGGEFTYGVNAGSAEAGYSAVFSGNDAASALSVKVGNTEQFNLAITGKTYTLTVAPLKLDIKGEVSGDITNSTLKGDITLDGKNVGSFEITAKISSDYTAEAIDVSKAKTTEELNSSAMMLLGSVTKSYQDLMTEGKTDIIGLLFLSSMGGSASATPESASAGGSASAISESSSSATENTAA